MRQVTSPVSSDDEDHSSECQHETCEYDEVYFFRYVTVKIDDTLFKLPRVYLEQSDVLRILMDYSKEDSRRSESEPLRIEGCSPNEFRQLLRILVPTIHGQTPLLTSSECMSVLKLATMWKYESIRAAMIHRMLFYARKDPILKIMVAIQYDVPDWFIPGVSALAQRDGPLTSDDVDRFNSLQDRTQLMVLLLKITAVRECFHGSSSAARHSYDFTPHICDVFGLTPYTLPETDSRAGREDGSNPSVPSHSAKQGTVELDPHEGDLQPQNILTSPPYEARRSQHEIAQYHRDEVAATAARVEGQRLEEITRRTAATLALDQTNSRKERRGIGLADAIARSRLLHQYENQAQEAELGHLQMEYALCQAHRAKQGSDNSVEYREALDHLRFSDRGPPNSAIQNLQSTAVVLAVLQNEVQPIKAAADADEKVAAALERQSGTDLAKIARASAARRKARSSARILLPVLRNLMIAENQYREARRLIEVQRISLLSAAPQ